MISRFLTRTRFAEAADLGARLMDMIDAIRGWWFTRDSWIFYALERNMYHNYEHERLLTNKRKVKMLYERNRLQLEPGIFTSHRRKMEYAMIFINELSHEAIRLPAEGLVITDFESKRKEVWNSKCNNLFEQFRNMRPTSSAGISGNPSDEPGGFSGKIGRDGKIVHNQHDDSAMSALIAIGNQKRLVRGEFPGINISDYLS